MDELRLRNFSPIRTERIYQKIVEQIRGMMNSGQLNPGDRLPSEREIAEQLGVSRAAVREAFSALEMSGLIEVRPGEGSFVKSGDLVTPFALLLSLDSEHTTASEMMEIRRGLEGEAAALAAERATEEDLTIMRRCLEKMEQDLTSPDSGSEADWEFHLAIAVAAKNVLLLKVMHPLQDALRKTVYTARRRLYSIAEMPERLLKEHHQIYEAIQSKNPAWARQCMVHHVSEAQRNSGL